MLYDIPRIPDSSSVIVRLIEARGNEIRLQPTPLAAKRRIARLALPEPVAFPRSRRTSAVIVRRICPDHAGAGGARSRAISIRMSLNIRSDTATSAICWCGRPPTASSVSE
jgi:hypothetical protein